jgi:hypothetical protein
MSGDGDQRCPAERLITILDTEFTSYAHLFLL